MPFLIAIAIGLFGLRLAAPDDILDQDQERPSLYVLDIIKNGNWLCQRDVTGAIASKPPIHPWIGALGSLVVGRVTPLTLYLPGALAMLGTALLVYQLGRRCFGERAGLWAALAVMVSPAGLKAFALVRTDGVFEFTVALAAGLAFRAWMNGRGWTLFWLAATAATLTKGPLGLLLAGLGLLAVFWERRSGERWPLRGAQWLGLALFLVLCAGWLWLAYAQYGQPVLDRLFGKELVGHVVADRKGKLPGTYFYQPPLYYLARALPWSLAAVVGLWRVCKWPSADAVARRLERFAFCWFVGGLAIFALAPHQRGDHLWPLLPAGALLAGREVNRWTARVSGRTLGVALALGLVLCGVGGWQYYACARAQLPPVRQGASLRQMAATITEKSGADPEVTFIDAPDGLQVYLNVFRPRVDVQRGAELLRSPAAAVLALNDLKALEAARQTNDPPLHILADNRKDTDHPTYIVSNRPEWRTSGEQVFAYGALKVTLQDMDTLAVSERRLRLRSTDAKWSVQVVNESDAARDLEIEVHYGRNVTTQHKVLGGREIWAIKTPGS